MSSNHEAPKTTAQKIRKALKKAFPGVKFSVRTSTYSMGSSVYVSYEDGPIVSAVEEIAKAYESTSFHGMDDSTEHHGYVDPDDGQLYHGAGYVSVSRTVSEELRVLMLEEGRRQRDWGHYERNDYYIAGETERRLHQELVWWAEGGCDECDNNDRDCRVTTARGTEARVCFDCFHERYEHCPVTQSNVPKGQAQQFAPLPPVPEPVPVISGAQVLFRGGEGHLAPRVYRGRQMTKAQALEALSEIAAEAVDHGVSNKVDITLIVPGDTINLTILIGFKGLLLEKWNDPILDHLFGIASYVELHKPDGWHEQLLALVGAMKAWHEMPEVEGEEPADVVETFTGDIYAEPDAWGPWGGDSAPALMLVH